MTSTAVTEIVTEIARPEPHPTPVSQGFWDATRRRQLVVQQCRDCSAVAHPPLPACRACWSSNLGWRDLGTTGTVASFTILRQGRVAGFEGAIPLPLVLVEMDDCPRALFTGNYLNGSLDDLRVGAPVRLAWEPLPSGLALPQFVPRHGDAR